MNQRSRYTVNDVSNNRFYQMPKFLFEGEFKDLSNDSRVLYSLLRDRHELSIKNNWINENNEVYLVYSRKNMEEILGLSDKTVKKLVEQLIAFGLLEEERMGFNRTNRIYLTSVSLEFTGVGDFTSPESEILRFKSRNNSESGVGDFTSLESEILRPNDTDLIKTNFSDIKSINQDPGDTNVIDVIDGHTNTYGSLKALIASNICYESLRLQYSDPGLVDEIYNILVDTVSSSKSTFRISSEDKPCDVVKSVYLKLTDQHIVYVITCLENNTVKANNIKSYMMTALYNAPMTMDSFYMNWVNNGSYGKAK